MRSPPEMRTWTSADGLSLVARDYAAAAGPELTAVICLHGLSRNSLDFETLAEHLAARGRRVLALDIRGRGRSEWDDEPANYNPAVYAADILALMHALGIASAVFVGTSMGGLITMVLAAIRPQAVRGAVLNDVGPAWRSEGMARIIGSLTDEAPLNTWEQAAAQAQANNRHAFPDYGDQDWDRMARRMYSPGPDGRLVRYFDPAILIGAKAASGAPAPDLWPLFTGLAADRPTLLLRGELSELIDEAIAARMLEAAPNMTCVTVPRVGHAPMLDEPVALTAIEAFLDQVE